MWSPTATMSATPLPTDTAAVRLPAWRYSDWVAFSLLLAAALVLRLAFFNGMFGSDDTVYFGRSLQIANGHWSSANYNGALRYGYNIPEGILLRLFGTSVWTATLWPLLCSLGEIAAVYLLAMRYAGRRAALFSAILLATIPLHIAVATRGDADPVVSFFLTLSFVLFFFAEERRHHSLFFATGLSMGMVFWSKELALVTLIPFLSYPLIFRRFDTRWVFVILGGLVMLALNMALMQAISGDPVHEIRIVLGQMQTGYIDMPTATGGVSGTGYYFKYMFLNPRHTWLVPYIALIAAISLAARRNSLTASRRLQCYALWWGLGLILVLTFFPVSLHPIRLPMKQSNYLTLFLAPIALLAGIFLARLRAGPTLATAAILGGILLGALEQRAYRVVTANSRAALIFAAEHPSDWILGTTANTEFVDITSLLHGESGVAERFGGFRKGKLGLEHAPLPATVVQSMQSHPIGYAVFDIESFLWRRAGWPGPLQPPSCWHPVTTLQPVDNDLSEKLLRGALKLTEVLSPSLARQTAARIHWLLQPQPATVYKVDARNLWCDQ